jgi:hypothetical protein
MLAHGFTMALHDGLVGTGTTVSLGLRRREMLNRTRFEDLPTELAKPLRTTEFIVESYLQGLSFIIHDTARDPNYVENHLLFYLAQDLLQSATSIVSLAIEGLISVAKRELRFVVETSIKLCFVQQNSHGSTVAMKVSDFDRELSSPSVSIKGNLVLHMLPEALRGAFIEETGRICGLTSKYVHLTPHQILERIAAVNVGRTAGYESATDVETLNTLVSRSLATSLVLIYHSVPDYVAGDWLVECDGSTIEWYFMASRFLGAMDAHFDYKAERQTRLAEIAAGREAKIKF